MLYKFFNKFNCIFLFTQNNNISKLLLHEKNYIFTRLSVSFLFYFVDLNLSRNQKFFRFNHFIFRIFNIIWSSELRSSNFNVKVYNFFNKWHNSALTTSFYDFLLKTKLLRDEVYFEKCFKSDLYRRYENIKRVETRRYYDLWDKYGLLDHLSENLKKTGKIWGVQFKNKRKKAVDEHFIFKSKLNL